MDAATGLPGTGGKRKPSARARCVALSPTGRTWAAATTEGLAMYSLDDELVGVPGGRGISGFEWDTEFYMATSPAQSSNPIIHHPVTHRPILLGGQLGDNLMRHLEPHLDAVREQSI